MIIFSLILFGLSILIIIALIIRKFSQLVLLDIDSLPEVIMAHKKNEIIRRRAEKQAEATNQKLTRWVVVPLNGLYKKLQRYTRALVGDLEQRVARMSRLTRTRVRRQSRQEVAPAVSLHITEGHAALDGRDFASAEQHFIAAVKLDEHCLSAYLGLGDVYRAQGQFEEAKQTYRFALYLKSRDEHALISMAEIAEAEGRLDTAVQYYQEAVLQNDSVSTRFSKLYELLTLLGQSTTALEAAQQAVYLEPQNPKYLDNLIEASIMAENKKLAESALQELRKVNPENQKLSVFRERISQLS